MQRLTMFLLIVVLFYLSLFATKGCNFHQTTLEIHVFTP